MRQTAIPFLQIRGGSSKGVYLNPADLPVDIEARNEVIKWIMGAHGDPRQVDGLGGADPLTSKIGLVSKSVHPDCDVDYTFIQAIVGEDRVDDTPNCGNILAGVGAYALETGLVTASGSEASISVYMTNSGNRCQLKFPIKDGLPVYEGSTIIDGVLGSAAAVSCLYADLEGSACGALLPTGNVTDIIDGITITCIDNGMPVVVLKASDFDISGDESPDILNADIALKEKLESIRLQAGHIMQLGDVSQKAVPKMCLVSKAKNGGAFNTRTFIPKDCHKAIGVLGAVTAATAACLKGSAISEIATIPDGAAKSLTIEHPSGVFDVQLDFDGEAITGAGLVRTARLLSRGEVYVPATIWPART